MESIVLAGLFILVATSLGSIIAVFFRRLPPWGLDFSLAFSGGVMLVASFTSLILPALEKGSIYTVLSGITSGFGFIYFIEKAIPHEEYFFKFEVSPDLKDRVKGIFLIVSAIIIHNLPEGAAVGVSMANDVEKGWVTAIAIGIQDIPEGLAVSLPLIFLSKRMFIPILIGVLSGFSEFVFAVLGGLTFNTFYSLLPFGLSLSGGAMIYVTVKEVFPQVYGNKHEEIITLGFLIGLLIMLYLDTTLG
ncbi:MAG: ZIP family metal transporter [Aquificota bacterium]|nr:MAG: ZIP family metal transporter [Aquificota bacterium]